MPKTMIEVRAWYRQTWMGRERLITNGRLLMVTAASMTLFIAVPYMVRADSQRRAAEQAQELVQARKDNAAAQYSADLASYQNARDERTRCEQAVATRADLRGVLLGIFNAIDPTDEKPLVLELRAQLDRDYPPRTLAECPEIAVPPTPKPYGG